MHRSWCCSGNATQTTWSQRCLWHCRPQNTDWTFTALLRSLGVCWIGSFPIFLDTPSSSISTEQHSLLSLCHTVFHKGLYSGRQYSSSMRLTSFGALKTVVFLCIPMPLTCTTTVTQTQHSCLCCWPRWRTALHRLRCVCSSCTWATWLCLSHCTDAQLITLAQLSTASHTNYPCSCTSVYKDERLPLSRVGLGSGQLTTTSWWYQEH